MTIWRGFTAAILFLFRMDSPTPLSGQYANHSLKTALNTQKFYITLHYQHSNFCPHQNGRLTPSPHLFQVGNIIKNEIEGIEGASKKFYFTSMLLKPITR
jgi:hypothetical protein